MVELSITGQQPGVWFPVVKPDDVKEIVAHVLAYAYEENGRQLSKGGKSTSGVKLPPPYFYLKMGVMRIPTGIGRKRNWCRRFSRYSSKYILTTDRVTGLDDYGDLDSIIQELEIRVAQISRIFRISTAILYVWARYCIRA